MLTATEVVFIKDLIDSLNESLDKNTYQSDVDMALELLNKIEPIDTNYVLDYLELTEGTEE